MNSDKNKQPKQTTVTPDDNAITTRELTPDEADRVKGGINTGASSSVANATDE